MGKKLWWWSFGGAGRQKRRWSAGRLGFLVDQTVEIYASKKGAEEKNACPSMVGSTCRCADEVNEPRTKCFFLYWLLQGIATALYIQKPSKLET